MVETVVVGAVADEETEAEDVEGVVVAMKGNGSLSPNSDVSFKTGRSSQSRKFTSSLSPSRNSKLWISSSPSSRMRS